MNNKGIKYEFSATPYLSEWTFTALPKDLSALIRGNFKNLEEGWGRMKISAQINRSEWKTSIWFDTKQNTYLLPLNAAIRKKENIVIGTEVKITIWI
jgi:hypothetical protein